MKLEQHQYLLFCSSIKNISTNERVHCDNEAPLFFEANISQNSSMNLLKMAQEAVGKDWP